MKNNNINNNNNKANSICKLKVAFFFSELAPTDR